MMLLCELGSALHSSLAANSLHMTLWCRQHGLLLAIRSGCMPCNTPGTATNVVIHSSRPLVIQDGLTDSRSHEQRKVDFPDLYNIQAPAMRFPKRLSASSGLQ